MLTTSGVLAICLGMIFVFAGICVRPQAGEPLRWEAHPAGRFAKLEVPTNRGTGFILLTNQQLGIRFTNVLTFQRVSVNHNLLNGAGVATGDFDGDGWCDLYFCNLSSRNALYRNLGNWRFEDVTDSVGVACTNQISTGAVFADINGDSTLDLLVTSCGGPNACFINDGKGRFKNMTETAGLTSKYGSTSMALADVEGDGDLDLYVANYGENTMRSGLNITTRKVGGRDVVTGRYANRIRIINGRLVEYGEPDVLYLNDGKGKFTPVPWTEGAFRDANGASLAAVPWDMGLSVQFRDLNNDGAPDIYVCNDFQSPDRIWINDGKGQFRALTPDALSYTSQFSMAMDAADINRDGLLDFFVADMSRRSHRDRMRQMAPSEIVLAPGETHDRSQLRRNTLFLNRGDGTWADIANYAGVGASDWTWCSVFLDVDLDGFEDLLIANGHEYDTEDLDATEFAKSLGNQRPQDSRTNLLLHPKLEVANALFRNRGDLNFEEVGTKWGFHSKQVSHGMALADFDNDGDSDVVVNCLNAPPLIYRNATTAPRVAVKLKGLPPNSQGIGAKVELLGGPAPQSQEIIAGGRYLSGSDPMRLFACGKAIDGMRLKVSWRSGKQSIVTNVLANRLYELDERNAMSSELSPNSEIQGPGARSQSPPLFADVSHLLNHNHRQESFDDFARQPLLPRKLSQSGPGVGWMRWSTDENQSIVVGVQQDGRLVTLTARDGKFESSFVQAPAAVFAGLALWAEPKQQPSMLLGTSIREPNQVSESMVAGLSATPKLTVGRPTPPKRLGIPGTNPSSLSVADIDGDGDLDLFVGGRSLPFRYPEATPSLLFRNERGELQTDPTNKEWLRTLGLVNGSVFSDLDSDGLPELILACEWGSIRVFRNQAGQFTEITSALRLSQFTGSWQGVTTGDFDGDGQLDIVASNWGLNSVYDASAKQPVLMYYGDFSGSGGVDIIEAEFDPEQNKIVPRRSMLDVATALPFVRAKFSAHRTYGQASVGEILGDAFTKAKELKVTTLASMVFLNRGDRFEPIILPPEAQFAPAFGVSVADFNGDGNEDVFLAQNFSGTQTYMAPLKEGRGLVLLGDGQGHFKAMPGSESGITLASDQRGAAVADFDGDRRVDLVVAQNSGATKLFRNSSGREGLRVRLVGPPGNPDAVGATVRLIFGERFGPAREIHNGSGYWSQDSHVFVLAAPEVPNKLWVRWPGGKATSTVLPQDTTSVTVDERGTIK